MVRASLIIAVLCAGSVALWLLWTAGEKRAGVHLSGDYADLVGAALGLPQVAPDEAALSVVLLHRWSNLRHVPDGVALCGEACSGNVVLVRVVAVGPGQSRKHLFLRSSAFFDLTVSMPQEGDGPDGVDCVAQVIMAEASALGAPNSWPDCARGILDAEDAVAEHWRL